MVGLGNPEPRYTRTPHNLGFLTVEELARRWGARLRADRRARANVADAHREGERRWLLEPLTYMNLSGEAVRPFCDYYNIPSEEILVVCDDHDLPWGRLRLRASGSGAGHKGLASIERHLGSNRYARLRIGIRPRNPKSDLVDYVLSPFFGDGAELADIMVATAADAIEAALRSGVGEAMNRFNGLDLAADDS